MLALAPRRLSLDFLQGIKQQLHHGAEFLSQVRDQSIRFSFFDIFTTGATRTKTEKVIIRVFSTYNHFSELCLLSICLWTAALVPFILAYHDVIFDENHLGPSLSASTVSRLLLALDFCIDITYLIGVLMLLKTSFIDDDSGFEIVDHGKLKVHRLKSVTWWCDVASCLPWLVMEFVMPGAYWMLILKVLRVWRLSYKPARFRVVPNPIFDYLYILTGILIAGHWVACLFFKIAYTAATLDDFHLKEMAESTGAPIVRYFLFCYKMGVYLLIGMDREGYSDYENMLLSVFAPVGSLVQAVVLGRVLVLVQRRSALQTQADETTQKLRQAMVSLHIPPSLQLRILSYFTYQRTHSAFTFSELFKGLSEHLLFEMNLFLYHDLVSNTELFKRTPAKVVKEIIMVLKDTVYLPGDFICRPGDEGTAMFFIVSGVVSVLTSRKSAIAQGYEGLTTTKNADGTIADKPAQKEEVVFDSTFKTVAVFGKGGSFGEVSVLTGEKQTAYVRADIFVTLATLYKNDFHQIIKTFPEQLGVLLSQMNRKVQEQLAESARKQKQKAHLRKAGTGGRLGDREDFDDCAGSDISDFDDAASAFGDPVPPGAPGSAGFPVRRASRSATALGLQRRGSKEDPESNSNNKGQRRWSRTRSFSSTNIRDPGLMNTRVGQGLANESPPRRSSMAQSYQYRRSSSLTNLEIAEMGNYSEIQYLRKQSTGNVLAVPSKSESKKRMSTTKSLTAAANNHREVVSRDVSSAAARAAQEFEQRNSGNSLKEFGPKNDEEDIMSPTHILTPKFRPPELQEIDEHRLSPIKEQSPSLKSVLAAEDSKQEEPTQLEDSPTESEKAKQEDEEEEKQKQEKKKQEEEEEEKQKQMERKSAPVLASTTIFVEELEDSPS